MPHSRRYRLAPGVRVRKEKFGLLFYSSKASKLTLVHSGDLIGTEYFEEQKTRRRRPRAEAHPEANLLFIEASLSKLLPKLVEKGLIVETVADP